MSSKTVALFISDKKLSEKVFYFLRNKARNVEIDLNPENPESYKIVITDKKLKVKGKVKVIKVCNDLDLHDTLRKIRLFLRLPTEPRKVTIGIDPGKRIGLAVLCSNLLVDFWTSQDESELVFEIEKLIEMLKVRKSDVEIKIGRGTRFKEIYKTFVHEGFDKILAIDEKNTTIKNKNALSKLDEELNKEVISAIKIALRT